MYEYIYNQYILNDLYLKVKQKQIFFVVTAAVTVEIIYMTL